MINLKEDSTATVNLKTERFDNTDSAVIVSSVSKVVEN